MPSDVVIRVESLSKQYRLGQISGTTLREDLQRWWARVRGHDDPTLKVTEANVRDRKREVGGQKSEVGSRKSEVGAPETGSRSPTSGSPSAPTSDLRPPTSGSPSAPTSDLRPPTSPVHADADYVWALKDVSFEVKRGEVLGIIGRNGAGKSTLLKILSRITAPTTGQIKVKGRIASLLEVGTGMHPELTGRENIYLNGAILGMTKAEITGKLDEIIDFSGVERFIDTPVKRYSSGMMVRLGFAVAAHLEPEILIVDEVLAVGDAEFQKKCFDRMGSLSAGGRTILLVSHHIPAVVDLCGRAVWLAEGGVRDVGTAAHIAASYLEAFQWHSKPEVIRHGSCLLESACVCDARGLPRDTLRCEENWSVRVRYSIARPVNAGVSLRLVASTGAVVFDVHEAIGDSPIREAGTYESCFSFSHMPLAPGRYSLSVYIMVHRGVVHLSAEHYVSFAFVGGLHGAGGASLPYDLGGIIWAKPAVETTRR
jgi:lipopolysaccharide transport system ATP-binding protein